MTSHAPNHNPKTVSADSETLWVGIDVSKAELQLHSHDASLKLPAKLTNDPAGFKSLLKHLVPRDRIHIVFEATGGYDKPLLDWLHGQGIACSRLNPRRVRNFARSKGLLAKTDAIDAATLAEFAAVRKPEVTPARDPALEELMALVNYRRHLVAELEREEMQTEHAKPKSITALIKSRIRSLQAQIGKVEQLIAAVVRDNPLLKRAVKALVEVKGVGQLTAASLLASMPELGRLNRNQAAAMAGLAPFNNDSGAMRGKRTIQGGRPAVRKALYMAALTAARHNDVLSKTYQGMVAKGKPRKLALVAIMRKLLIHLNSIMSNVLLAKNPEESLTF